MSKLRSLSGAAIAGPHSFADHLTNRRAVSANIINHICRSVIPIVPLIDILKHFDSSAGEQLQSIIYGVLVFHGAKQQQPAAQQRRTMAALISPATPRLGPGALLPIFWCHARPFCRIHTSNLFPNFILLISYPIEIYASFTCIWFRRYEALILP